MDQIKSISVPGFNATKCGKGQVVKLSVMGSEVSDFSTPVPEGLACEGLCWLISHYNVVTTRELEPQARVNLTVVPLLDFIILSHFEVCFG